MSYEELPTDGSAVRVKVLDNDEDPDGSINELTVTTAESGVSVEGSDLLIPVTDSMRLVVYTITDRDGLTNSAVVTVPGRDTTAPFLNTAGLPIEMDAGTSRTINLADYVVTRSGRSPRLVDDSSPVAQTGLDSVVADSSTQLTLTANASFGGNSAFLVQVAEGDPEPAAHLRPDCDPRRGRRCRRHAGPQARRARPRGHGRLDLHLRDGLCPRHDLRVAVGHRPDGVCA